MIIMLNFRYADINDLDFLVELRIRDLRLFSNQEILPQTINKIRDFYKTGIINGTCFTLLGLIMNYWLLQEHYTYIP